MLKYIKSKVTVTALAIALAVPCQVAFAGVRAGGVSVSRPSVSVARPAPSFAPPARVSAPVQPVQPVVINRTVINRTAPNVPNTPNSSGANNSGGSSFMKDVAASAVGSAVGAGIVNYAMKPSTPAGAPAQQSQQIPSLKPWEVIVDCNNLTYKALDICRGRSTQQSQ